MKTTRFNTILAIIISLSASSCKKFIEVDAPVTSINSDIVFNTNSTAIAVLTGIYSNISKGQPNGYLDMSIRPELSADNLKLFATTNLQYLPYYKNSLEPSYTGTSSFLWSGSYQFIYSANAAIEGLEASTNLNPLVRQQLLAKHTLLEVFCIST